MFLNYFYSGQECCFPDKLTPSNKEYFKNFSWNSVGFFSKKLKYIGGWTGEFTTTFFLEFLNFFFLRTWCTVLNMLNCKNAYLHGKYWLSNAIHSYQQRVFVMLFWQQAMQYTTKAIAIKKPHISYCIIAGKSSGAAVRRQAACGRPQHQRQPREISCVWTNNKQLLYCS